jgi:hypothetical protein
MSKLNYAHVVAIIAVLGFALLPCTAARAALILYYPLNEGTGTLAHDQSASGNHGTVGGGSWTAPGESGSGYAAKVTASSSTETGVTTGGNVALGAGDFTVSLWFKGTPDGDWAWLAANGTGWQDTGNRLYIADYQGGLRVGMGAWFTDAYSPDTLPVIFTSTTDWYNVAVVRNGTTVTAYVNGAVYAAGTSSVTLADSTIQFGAQKGGNGSLAGAIDDLAIWNQALTPGQVAAIAAGASPLTIPEPSMLVLAGLGLAAATWRKRT